MKIVERIALIIKEKKISVRAFEISIGASNGLIGRAISKGTDISAEWISKIIEVMPDISATWLLTGEGDMLKAEIDAIPPVNNFSLYTDRSIDSQEVPLYDLSASAGLSSLFCNSAHQIPIDTIKIPNVPKCDGAIYVTGDSMYPLLKAGDIILYKQICDIKNYILWGEIYIISFELDGDEFVTVKFINKSDEADHIKLVSQNSHHASMDIHLSCVRGMALVKASIRFNTIR